jgi:DNA-binding MarR family transcriptional regulator
MTLDGSPGAAPRPTTRITYLVKQLERAIRAEMDQEMSAMGLTALQYTALTVLQRHPGMSGAQLSRRSFVSAQAGSEMITNLERKGYIRRRPHPESRRILQIELSDAGQKVVESREGWMNELEEQMLAQLSPNETAMLRSALERCVRSLKPDAHKTASEERS